jgi:hypothetical protein
MRNLWCAAREGIFLGGGLISLISPTLSYACAVCGGAEDNGYFWGVLFLMSMPFAIGSFVGGWLWYSYRRSPPAATPSTPRTTLASCPSPLGAESSATEGTDPRT